MLTNNLRRSYCKALLCFLEKQKLLAIIKVNSIFSNGLKMFKAARIYIQRNLKTGKTEWFFKAREGDFGPFSCKEVAKQELDLFIKQCIEKGEDGGRKSRGKASNRGNKAGEAGPR
ncbi:hypothetical protein [Candidatus Methylomicrobium oryzae]|jgi:hypothetical protein|uniref:hypothetical protein n=1 Tax=Candidatus Methylomicrobium oryzae TaxID=2802053 RepID=UPI001922D519|nr:hypothetical protein [Methylomicrobium sp. RS1]MBL1265243.1 hypothetical protein [Methylomicrobium sp. RS1]